MGRPLSHRGLLVVGLLLSTALAPGGTSWAQAQQTPAPALPGEPAPGPIVQELQAAIALAGRRFEAKDIVGLLALVSDQYRTGYLTKSSLRVQLVTMFQLYEALQVSVRVEAIRLVGGQAWIYSSGEVTGKLPLVTQWMSVLSWERELEVARREAGGWRLYGYQQ